MGFVCCAGASERDLACGRRRDRRRGGPGMLPGTPPPANPPHPRCRAKPSNPWACR